MESMAATGTESANALYKKYTDFCKSRNEKPLPFKDWLPIAKQKKLLSADGDYSADSAPAATSAAPGTAPALGGTATPAPAAPAATTAPAKTPAKSGGIMKTLSDHKGKILLVVVVVGGLYWAHKAGLFKKLAGHKA